MASFSNRTTVLGSRALFWSHIQGAHQAAAWRTPLKYVDPAWLEHLPVVSSPKLPMAVDEAIVDAVESLPPLQRQLVEAVFWEGLSLREFSRTHSLNRNICTKEMKAGLQQLASLLVGRCG